MSVKSLNKLVRLANKAGRLSHAYTLANHAYIDEFEKIFGHREPNDSLVELVEYGSGKATVEDFLQNGHLIDGESDV